MSVDQFTPQTDEVFVDDPVVVSMTGSGPEDIDAVSWLSGEQERAKEIGYVEIDGKRLKIAPLTEAEDNALIQQSRWMNKATNKVEMRGLEYRRRVVAKSLTKADPDHPVEQSQLMGALSGNVSTLFLAIHKLSGMDTTRSETADPFGSSI